MTLYIPKKTIVALRISEVLYYIVAVIFILGLMIVDVRELPPADQLVIQATAIATIILGISMGVFIEKVIYSLKKGKFWSWVAAIILCGLYIPSIFLPLGIMGLLGLLSSDTKKIFLKN